VFLSTVIWTLGEAFFMPPMNVLVMRHAQGGKNGQYSGLFFMSWSASALLSPVLWAVVWSLRRPQRMAFERDAGASDPAVDLPCNALIDPGQGAGRQQACHLV
jgi:hypothetical protein